MAKKKQVSSKRSTQKTQDSSPKQSFTPRKLFLAGLLLVLFAFAYQYLKPYIFQSSEVFEIAPTRLTETGNTMEKKPETGSTASPVPCTPAKVKSINSSGTCGEYGFSNTTYTCSNGQSGRITKCTEMADLAIQIQKACGACSPMPAPSGTTRVSPTPRPSVSVADQLNQCIARCNTSTGINTACVSKCNQMYPSPTAKASPTPTASERSRVY